jgi:hypothetical protein
MITEIFSTLPIKVHEMKRIVEVYLNLLKTNLPKANDLMQEMTRNFPLSKSKQNLSKSSSIHSYYAAFDISTIDKFTHKVIRAFAHDLNFMTFEVTLDTENLLIEAVDAIIAQAGEDETLTKLLIDFTMEKPMMISWDISREILDTGRLVLKKSPQ